MTRDRTGQRERILVISLVDPEQLKGCSAAVSGTMTSASRVHSPVISGPTVPPIPGTFTAKISSMPRLLNFDPPPCI
jgi:hypothetical protein